MVMIPQTKTAAAAATSKPSIPAKAVAAPTPGPAAETVNETASAPAEAPAEAAAPAPTTTAVAPRPANAVAMAGRPRDLITETFKNAFTVDWNTLNRIQASNGNFLDVELNKQAIGQEITLEIMSFQDHWQISPGTDDDNDAQYVRYSDDGKLTTEGEDCNEYLAALKVAGYDGAKMTQRLVLAGNIVGGSHDGKLVQINLPPTSKAMFDRFRMQASIDIAKAKRTPDDLRTLKLKAMVETKGKNSWTKVAFDYAT